MARRVLVVDDSATLRKLMSAVLEEAGYEVEAAVDGADGLEKVQRGPFDLVLVDFVMPRLNGYQLTQALRSIPSLRSQPVVLVSARAEQIGGRFMAQTGAVAVLDKPFTPATLLSVVARAVGRGTDDSADDDSFEELVETGPGDDRPQPDSSPDVSYFDPNGQDLSAAWFDDDLSARARLPAAPTWAVQASVPAPPWGTDNAPEAAAERFAMVLGRALLPVVNDLVAGGVPVVEGALVQALQAYLPVTALGSLARELRALDPALRGTLALDGMLGSIPLGEVFQLLNLQAQTGLLVIERWDAALDGGDALRGDGVTERGAAIAEVTVAFREGRIDQCIGRGMGTEFLLGRFLSAEGVVASEAVEALAATHRERGMLLGEALVADGLVRVEDLAQALARQTGELVYELLRWSSGRFRFETGATLPEAQRARLGLPGETLVLEAFRRIDEWRLIEQYITPDATVLLRNDGLISAVAVEQLDRDERRVLDAVDGTRSVRAIVTSLGMASFDGCKILYRLVRARLVAIVRR